MVQWLDFRACNHKVVGSIPTKPTTFYSDEKYMCMSSSLNHKFLICAINHRRSIIIDVQPMFVRDRLSVASLVFISPCGSLPTLLEGNMV